MSSAKTVSGPRLPLFTLLESPYGMQSAVTTAFPLYILHAQGVSLEKAAAIAAVANLPASLYFLYSPVVDFFVRRRTWYMLAVVLSALLCGGVVMFPAVGHLQVITVLLFAGTVAVMLISASTGGLMNTLLTRKQKSQVGAWVQAGNLGSQALMLAALIFASSRCNRTLLGVMVAGMMLLPGLSILGIREPLVEHPEEGLGATVKSVGLELKELLLSWRSLPGILLLCSPIGNGAITTTLNGLTEIYHATAAQLVFANGWGGGALCAAGALSTLLVPPRWNRLLPYALAGALYGTISLLIGLGPLHPSTLILGALASNFGSGVAYGAVTGLVLQTIGAGGRCHSSRYTILISMANLCIVYMTALLGWVAQHLGPHAMGEVDGGLNLGTAALFFAWWIWARRRKSSLTEDVPEDALPILSAAAS
jgi:PAT family beta-lactamase induction signal transducer AmpG